MGRAFLSFEGDTRACTGPCTCRTRWDPRFQRIGQLYSCPMDTNTEASGPLNDLREVPLARIGSLAGAGLLNKNTVPAKGDTVKVAAFNSSI